VAHSFVYLIGGTLQDAHPRVHGCVPPFSRFPLAACAYGTIVLAPTETQRITQMSDFRSFWQRRVGDPKDPGPTFSAQVSKNPPQRMELHAVLDYDPDIQLVAVRT
jgi:hypothetical protein